MIRKSFISAFIGSAAEPAEPAPVAVRVTAVRSQAVDRFLRVTGSLAADEQAEVAAGTGGRVMATPVERGTRVAAGAVLVRLSGQEADASLREAEANAAQIEARLGLTSGQPFDPAHVPQVLNAKASLDWAEADFNRIRALLDQKVVSQSEFDQKQTGMQAARQQYRTAQNAARQSYLSLQAARARVDLARKTAADTFVKAPFAGLVAGRVVSTGDYVTRGMKVATVVRIDPLRVELTVPESTCRRCSRRLRRSSPSSCPSASWEVSSGLHEEPRPDDGIHDHGVAARELHADADVVGGLDPRGGLEGRPVLPANRSRLCACALVGARPSRNRGGGCRSGAPQQRAAFQNRQQELPADQRSV